jgi:hypothetical protein
MLWLCFLLQSLNQARWKIMDGHMLAMVMGGSMTYGSSAGPLKTSFVDS